jgi:hypothetical protein
MVFRNLRIRCRRGYCHVTLSNRIIGVLGMEVGNFTEGKDFYRWLAAVADQMLFRGFKLKYIKRVFLPSVFIYGAHLRAEHIYI